MKKILSTKSEILNKLKLSKHKCAHLSFPRRRESILAIHNWIPACAGMTVGIGQFVFFNLFRI